jgi:hypothetical protein
MGRGIRDQGTARGDDMSKDFAEVVARVKTRRTRAAQNHPRLAREARERLDCNLSIEEAMILVERSERSAYAVYVGRFRISTSRAGKVNISVVGDGEGGEFAEDELAVVIEKFYGKNF